MLPLNATKNHNDKEEEEGTKQEEEEEVPHVIPSPERKNIWITEGWKREEGWRAEEWGEE